MISRKTPEPRLDRASQIGTFVAYKILSDYVEGKTDVDVGDTRATNTIIQQKVREEMLGEWGFWRLRHPRAAPATEREIEEATGLAVGTFEELYASTSIRYCWFDAPIRGRSHVVACVSVVLPDTGGAMTSHN